MSESAELPPVATEPLSVLLLARDDAPYLAEVLGAWLSPLAELGRPYEIILVDDASGDGTGGLAEFLAGRQPRIRVLRHTARQGPGAAFRTGLAAAQYPLLLSAPCDRQYEPASLKAFLEAIDKVHLVSGCRVLAPVPWWLRGVGLAYRGLVRLLLGESRPPLPGWLGWSGQARRLGARLFFGVRLRDVECPFRLYRRSIFERIPIQSNGGFAQVEILAKANFLGCIMCEEEVPHRPRPRWAAEPFRRLVHEARRVLSNPDFGPAEPEVGGQESGVSSQQSAVRGQGLGNESQKMEDADPERGPGMP